MNTIRSSGMVGLSAVVAFGVMGGVATAEPDGGVVVGGGDGSWKTYDGYALVRTWPADARQTLALASLDLVLMDEAQRFGGGTRWLANPEQRGVLDAAGVRYDVLEPDIGVGVRAERARLEAERARWARLDAAGARFARIDDTFFDEFRPYEDAVAPDLQEFLDQLLAEHPGMISAEVIGRSQAEGRDIEAYTISAGPAADGGAKPAVFFTGMCHAREWISPMTVLYMMDRLLDGYGSDAAITAALDGVDVMVVPISNPDGYVFSWESQRFWRKTRRNNGNGTFGVDWNRNFSVGYGLGSSGSTNSDTYRGTSPFSEAETRAIRDFVNDHPRIVAHVDVHSYSQLILYPWGYTFDPVPGPDGAAMARLAEKMSDTILSTNGEFYVPEPGSSLYIAGGTSMDWTFGGSGAYSFTYELRPASQFQGGFAPPPDQIRPTAEEALAGFLDLFDAAGGGIIGNVLGGVPATVNEGQTTPVTVEVLPAFSDTLDVASATLFTRTSSGGGFDGTPMVGSGSLFDGVLPAGSCGETVEWYVSVVDAGGETYVVPSPGAAGPYAAEVVGVEAVVFDDVETDIGWISGTTDDTATGGFWERGDPEGTLAQPENDYSAVGVNAWITGLAAGGGLDANDVDGGQTTLTSPRLDATPPAGLDAEDAYLTFHYWFSKDTGGFPGSDALVVSLSNDNGALFRTIDTINESSNAWLRKSYRISDWVTPTDRMRVRFIATDIQSDSVVEAGVDDVSIEYRGCADPGGSVADLAPPFGVVDLSDVDAFIGAFLAQDPLADVDEPFGVLDLSDVDRFIAAFLAAG